jgi:hypothetical protein
VTNERVFRIPNPESESPSIAVELEPALQTLDAALDLCKVVRLATSRAGGLVTVPGGDVLPGVFGRVG